MRIALAQLDFTVGAFDANFSKIQGAIGQAERAGADLVVFSELAATGYFPRDLLNHPRFIDLNLELLHRVAKLSTGQLGILIGFVDRNTASEGKRLFNAAALCWSGRVAGRRYKSLLPTYDVFDEDRYFEPGHVVSPLELGGRHLGVTICEDVWNDRDFWPERLYHRDPVCDLVQQGADLLLNISASPFELGKAALRREMIRREALKNGRYFFYLNQVGGNDELVFDGHSIGVDPAGHEILRARDFEEDFLVYDVPSGPGDGAAPPPVLRDVSASNEEAAYRALVLGLRDYARKCGFSSVVLGLSGGIDSAVTACLAAAALGPENVLGVAMPSRYSAPESCADAAELARNLGIEFHVIPIDPMFQSSLDALAPSFKGLPPDLAEENLQARIRGVILMALSNKFNRLLLSTGNKSELAVGFCTLYGDMSGGLAILNDVPKTFVYRLAQFINHPRMVIPASTITKAPTAELRPNQLDADTLPPYDVLDAIVDAYVGRHLDVEAICALGFDLRVVTDVIRRINMSEYKRRQAAPGIKISSKAFGLGRRYPIAADYSPERT
jgi:NAD+ synthase (glutamine-hydrolysing)